VSALSVELVNALTATVVSRTTTMRTTGYLRTGTS
jgi:hypothetical protein